MPPKGTRGAAGRFASSASESYSNNPRYEPAVRNQAISSVEEVVRSHPRAW
jgi:hypothetical protein